MKAEKPNDKQFKEVEELVRKALAEKDKEKIELRNRLAGMILEKDREIEWLKKENKQLYDGVWKADTTKAVNQALSELRDEIEEMQGEVFADHQVMQDGVMFTNGFQEAIDRVLKAISSRRTA